MRYNFRPSLSDNIERISISDERSMYNFLSERSKQIKAGDQQVNQVIKESSNEQGSDRDD
jgi:hypothetical protein